MEFCRPRSIMKLLTRNVTWITFRIRPVRKKSPWQLAMPSGLVDITQYWQLENITKQNSFRVHLESCFLMFIKIFGEIRRLEETEETMWLCRREGRFFK